MPPSPSASEPTPDFAAFYLPNVDGGVAQPAIAGTYSALIACTVIFDANVLYPAPLRDLLIRLAQTRLFHGRWTEDILDEVFASVAADRPDSMAIDWRVPAS